MPAPIAVMSALTSLLASILIEAACVSTFRILPRSGRMACVFVSAALLGAEPPAESPSTMNSSQIRSGPCSGSRPASRAARWIPKGRPCGRQVISLARAGRIAGAGGVHEALSDHRLGASLRVLLENKCRACRHTTHPPPGRATSAVAQLGLGLPFELRVCRGASR